MRGQSFNYLVSLLEVLLLLPSADWRVLNGRKTVAGGRILPHIGQLFGRVPRVRVPLPHVGTPREAAAGAPGQRAGAVCSSTFRFGCNENKYLL